MSRARAVVHLGPIKTGTTALSRYFTLTNDAGTTPPHVVYPSGDLWFGEGGDIVRQRRRLEPLMDRRVHHLGNPTEALRIGGELDGALARVGARCRAGTTEVTTAVFVVETGLPRFNPQRVVDFFRRHFDEVDFVVVARRQDKLVASIVAQNMKMWEKRWSTLSPRVEMLRLPHDRDFDALDYDRQVRRWSSVVGSEHIIVIPYLEGAQGTFDMIDRFFDYCGLGKAPRVDGIKGLRIHPTYSVQGMKRLAHVKNIGRWAWFVPAFRPRLLAVWKTSNDAYHAGAIDGIADQDGTPYVPWTLEPNDRRWILRRFRASNRALRAAQSGHDKDWNAWITQLEEASS